MLPFEYISILAFQLIADLVWQLYVHQYISLLLAQPDTLMWDNIDFLYIILSFSKKKLVKNIDEMVYRWRNVYIQKYPAIYTRKYNAVFSKSNLLLDSQSDNKHFPRWMFQWSIVFKQFVTIISSFFPVYSTPEL